MHVVAHQMPFQNFRLALLASLLKTSPRCGHKFLLIGLRRHLGTSAKTVRQFEKLAQSGGAALPLMIYSSAVKAYRSAAAGNV